MPHQAGTVATLGMCVPLASGLVLLCYYAHRLREEDPKKAGKKSAWKFWRATTEDAQAQRPLRIWMDGAFDMFHYGHVNAFRQGRALGTHLVVGVNDDKSITQCKGVPPIMNDAERLAAVKACRFVDEVVPNVPYVMSDDYVRWVIKTYQIDLVVHGDDPCIVDGRDVYESAQALGKYKTIPRTEGISTTDITNRLLQPPNAAIAASPAATPCFVRESKFITTSRMLGLYADGRRAPPPGATVVYARGDFDMFHCGHADFLREAAKLGDYLLVGVQSDAVVHRRRRAPFPILNLNERVLSVLACRHVGDVVINPPWEMTREMIASLGISVVAIDADEEAATLEGGSSKDAVDPYAVPRALGLVRQVRRQTAPTITVGAIKDRLEANRERLQKKVEKKLAAEKEYYDQRYGFNGSATS